MTKDLKKSKTYLIIIIFFYLGLIVSFLFNENSSGGSQADFYNTLHLIKKISEDFLLGISDWKNSSLSHFPLHYILSAILYKFLNNIDNVRFLFLNISILIPFFFYKCIKIIFKNDNAAILLSILIFIDGLFKPLLLFIFTIGFFFVFFLVCLLGIIYLYII